MRPSEDVSNKAPTAAPHGMEGRPPLAAKPAPQHDQISHERLQATHPRPRQTLHVDRAILLARETARRIMEEPDEPNQHTNYHQNRTASAGRADAVR